MVPKKMGRFLLGRLSLRREHAKVAIIFFTQPRTLDVRPGIPLILLAVSLATPLRAGPWMQGAGQGFASASATIRQAEADKWRHELNYFGEYGWSDRVTLGVDLNQNDRVSGHALLFARIPLAMRYSAFPVALSVSGGGAHQGGAWKAMYRVTLSAGHSFQTERGSGWVSADATYEHRHGADDPTWKLDATIGWNRAGALSPMLQIETSKRSGEPLVYAVIPSLRYEVSEHQAVVAGLEYKEAGQRSLGLRLALWHRF
jgi:hypothetical protein